ncbi:MAG: peptidase M16 [Bacteroidia bacterium]|nr:MAG: peptidase M16 [Bacteroidia bacterium]
MKKWILSVSTLFFSLSQFVAQQAQLIEKVEPQPGKIVIPYEKYKLPNGLTILLHEDHSDPIVNVMVTYKVGSNREDLGRSGFAHFFEHMMFQGSKHVADEEHFKIIQSAGGTMNGFTTRDRTVYFETVPSNYLELMLWLEADRMGFLLDSLYARKFENQRDAVKNEKSQNFENQPYAIGFEEEIYKILYPPKHPYSWPTIGYVDELNAATLEDVRNFFLRWYGPNNAILTISGDFDKQQALKWIEKYFGSLKPCPEVKKLKTQPVILPEDKYGAYSDRVYFPLNLRVYPTVPQYHKDEAALDLLAEMMGGGKNSIFYQKFVKKEKAVQVGVSHNRQELIGEFQIYLVAYPPEDLNYEKLFKELDQQVKETLDEFEKTGITDEALARAKSKFEAQQYDVLESVFNKSFAISEWERLLGKGYTISDEIDRYNKVTKEDIIRVFNKYIKGSGAAVLNTYPIINPKDSVKSVNPNAGVKFPPNPEYANLKYEPNPDNFDRSVRPVPGTPKTVKIPDTYKFKLNNGIECLGTSFNETPKVVIQIELEGGDLAHGDIKKIGLTSLVADLMNESTKNYTAEQIEAELDKLGSEIYFSAGKQSTNITITSLKKNLDATLKILEEKLFNPAFKEDEFKLAKKQMREGIKQQEKQPEQMANKAYYYVLYGENLYGLSASVKTVDNITLNDVKNYYEKYYSPNLAKVVIVGDITEQEAKQKLEFLNKWTNKNVTITPPPVPSEPKDGQTFIVNKPGAPSSVIMMGYPSIKFDAFGDYYKNRIANFIFGGNFNSRINLNLREDKGYTYGIRSYFYGDKYKGEFTISSSVKRPATIASVAEILKEFKNYVENGITDKELEFTKNSLLNSEALKYESPSQKAALLVTMAKYNLDNNFSLKQNEILKNITKDEVNNQIKKYFLPNKLNTIMVGDKTVIEMQLERLTKDPKYSPIINNLKPKKLSID